MKIEFMNKLPKKNIGTDKKCYVFYNKDMNMIIKIFDVKSEEEIFKSEFISFLKYGDEYYRLEKSLVEEFDNSFVSDIYDNFFDEISIKLIKEKILKSETNWYIYILRCEDESLYTGIAIDYRKRLNKHISGKGAKYTRNKKVKKLEALYYVKGKGNALKIEYQIKKLSKIKKEELVKKPLILKELFCDIKTVQIGN